MSTVAWPALMGLAAVCAGRRQPAREIATRELRSEWSISRPALALPPPTSTAAWPSGPSGALYTGGDGGLAALGAGCLRVVGVSRF